MLKELLEERLVGIDILNDYAVVRLLVYLEDNQKVYYLQYLLEYEGFPGTERWYLGKITREQADSLSVYNALEMLESLEVYTIGGVFAGSEYTRSGPINIGFSTI